MVRKVDGSKEPVDILTKLQSASEMEENLLRVGATIIRTPDNAKTRWAELVDDGLGPWGGVNI